MVTAKRGSILTKEEILYYMREHQPIEDRLFISPLLDQDQIRDTSIDLRLGPNFLVSQASRIGALDLVRLHHEGRGVLSDNYREVRVPYGQVFALHPGGSVMAGTLEYVGIPACLQGSVTLRASVSDLPLISRTTQVHPGHKGIVTLTLTSKAQFSVQLCPGLRVAQLQLQRIEDTIATPRTSRYHEMTKPVPTRLHVDEDLRYLGPTVEPIIIGLASTIAAGRTTAVGRLLNSHGFTFFSLVDMLKDEAIARGLPTGRAALQALGSTLRETHGDSYLAERLRNSRGWLSSRSTLVVVDSFKHEAEVKEFQKQRRFTLLGITASEQLRWTRLIQRRRQGEPDTFEAFREQDAIDRGLKGIPHGQQTDRLLEIADFVIENNGTIPEFLSELDRFVTKLLYPSTLQEA